VTAAPSFSRQYLEADRLPGQPIPIKPPVAQPGVYPVDALSPRLAAAAMAIVDKVQLPASIAANSVLAAASLAVQGYIDVVLPTKEVIPVSLFMVTVAASGDRKSSADKLALMAMRERERELRLEAIEHQVAYAADAQAFAAAKKKATAGNKSREQMKQELVALGREPRPPTTAILTTDEGTLEGLQKLYADSLPTLGLFSDEGGQWLGGHSMAAEQRGKTGAALSKLWDGAPVKRVRGSEAVSFLPGRRLALHLMVQHKIAADLFGDKALRDQGLLSRMLVCQPISMKGERPWKEADELSDLALEKYNVRLYRLLKEPLPMDPDTRELDPRRLTLSDDARRLFIQWHDAVELELRAEGGFADIIGFAAKLPEHAVRIAAVMAFFESSSTTEISGAALSAGIKIARFHAAEALRIIGLGSVDEDSENAHALITWIRSQGEAVVGKRWMSRAAFPRELRGAAVLSRAIEVLVEHGHLVPIKSGAAMANGVHYREAFTVIADDQE